MRCYESTRQNQEGWSSLHAHFAPKHWSSATPQRKQKHLLRYWPSDCAQNIFSSFKTAEDGLRELQKDQKLSLPFGNSAAVFGRQRATERYEARVFWPSSRT